MTPSGLELKKSKLTLNERTPDRMAHELGISKALHKIAQQKSITRILIIEVKSLKSCLMECFKRNLSHFNFYLCT